MFRILRFFPEVHRPEVEFRKLGILRFLLGIIIFARYLEIIYSSTFFPKYVTTNFFIADATFLLVIFSFTIGFITNLSTLAVIGLMYYFDSLFHVPTLGSNICTQFLLVLFFANSGLFYSIDRLLVRSKLLRNSFISRILMFPGLPQASQLRTIYALGFFSYALVSMVALSYHLVDRFWTSGTTVGIMFTGAYMTKYYMSFRKLALTYPEPYFLFSKLAVIGQSIFQFLMIPLMIFRVGRFFTFWWGLMFFISAFFFLQLSYLPHVEILFWLALFIRPGSGSHITVYYDGKCNLCRRSIWLLRTLNFNQSVIFTSLWNAPETIEKYDLDTERLKVWMGGIYNDKVYFGYDLYLLIARKNPLYYLLLPILYLGKWTRVGYFIYSIIAKNRYKVFGQCAIEPPEKNTSVATPVMRNGVYDFMKVIYGLAFILFLFFEFPYFYNAKGQLLGLLPATTAKVLEQSTVKALYIIGFDVPIVFNEVDLTMNEKWFVLYRLRNGKKELVPIMDEHGAKLPLFFKSDIMHFSNHGSGILYYATVLPYRRAFIQRDANGFHESGNPGALAIQRIIYLDRKKNNISDTTSYYLEVRRDHSITGFNSNAKDDSTRFNYKVIYKKIIPPSDYMAAEVIK